MVVGRQAIPVGKVTFQGRIVKLRGGVGFKKQWKQKHILLPALMSQRQIKELLTHHTRHFGDINHGVHWHLSSQMPICVGRMDFPILPTIFKRYFKDHKSILTWIQPNLCLSPPSPSFFLPNLWGLNTRWTFLSSCNCCLLCNLLLCLALFFRSHSRRVAGPNLGRSADPGLRGPPYPSSWDSLARTTMSAHADTTSALGKLMAFRTKLVKLLMLRWRFPGRLEDMSGEAATAAHGHSPHNSQRTSERGVLKFISLYMLKIAVIF